MPRGSRGQWARTCWSSGRPAPARPRRSAGVVAERLGLVGVDMGEEAPRAHSCWLAATGSLPVLRHALGPGDQRRIEAPGDHQGPILVLAGSEGVIEAPVPISEWRVAIPEEDERALLWQSGGIDKATAADAARRSIARVRAGSPRSSRKVAAAVDPPEDSWSRLTEAIESGASQLDTLARRSSARVEREDLVIPGPLAEGLDLLVERIRTAQPAGRRSRLVAARPLSARRAGLVHRRVRHRQDAGGALAGAADGTAALPRRPGGNDQQVDPARPRRILSTVLDAAQHADVVLFFDEADSAIRRTHRRRRFPRPLRQRPDQLSAATDRGFRRRRHSRHQQPRPLRHPAFVRRLDSILEFPLPDGAARRLLWRTHIGEAHALTDRQIDALSISVDLAGGHIRNIVLSAAIRARRDERPIAFADIAAAATEEYAKLGRSPPDLPAC